MTHKTNGMAALNSRRVIALDNLKKRYDDKNYVPEKWEGEVNPKKLEKHRAEMKMEIDRLESVVKKELR